MRLPIRPRASIWPRDTVTSNQMPRHAHIAPFELTTFDPRIPRSFWLDGESVMCACPDCRAPISIRVWLMVADCWQCGCSIELTPAQERQIRELLSTEEVSTKVPSSSDESMAQPSFSDATTRRSSPRSKASTSRRASEVPVRQYQSTPSVLAVSDWFSQMPAWLISLLFHMALLALLALLILDHGGEEDPYITLSTVTDRMQAAGGDVTIQQPTDPFEYDLPVSQVPQTAQQARSLARANQAAKELRIAPDASVPQLPSVEQVKRQLESADPTRRTLAARDPRVRAEIVTKEGGTTLTEAAVARGLRWLSLHQEVDGNWSLHRFAHTHVCRGRCDNQGHIRSDSAATSLALLPFLGAGQTHQVGIYKDTVAKGLRWLLQVQRDDGDLSGRSGGNAKMYAHGQGAIVLCEAFAMTGDEQVRQAAQMAIDFIVAAQHRDGGWRYKPGEEGDTSVLGWQLMALQSARAAQLRVPNDTLALASLYLDSVQYDDGSRYAYQPHHRPSHVMTAEALLCRMYLGWDRDYASVSQGVRYLSRNHLPNVDRPNFYYWYYATQVFHHFGGAVWKRWNVKMREALVERQCVRGHEAGSWDPVGGHASQGGRLYSTAMATCTLEVYYRHAPIFRQLELE